MNPRQAKRELEKLNKIDNERKLRESAVNGALVDLGLGDDHVGLNVARWHLRNGGKINQTKARPIDRLNELCGVRWIEDSPMFKRLRAVAFGTVADADTRSARLARLCEIRYSVTSDLLSSRWFDVETDATCVWDNRLSMLVPLELNVRA